MSNNTGLFVWYKNKTIILFIMIFLIILAESFYCYRLKMNIKKLTIENEVINLALKNPKVIEKPKTLIKYITKTIEKEVPVEKIIEVYYDEGKISEPIIPELHKQKNWTAGLIYNFGGNYIDANEKLTVNINEKSIGIIITRRVYKTLETGIQINSNKTAGMLGTVKF